MSETMKGLTRSVIYVGMLWSPEVSIPFGSYIYQNHSFSSFLELSLNSLEGFII